ncbi:hypothetical protein [Weissella koreensis]|nr:hypothetical protein [Weissella koreensis]EJF33257.1 hypothetical protein JC2156_10080 [Weissella koreensis KCTC 3621]
MSYNNFDIIGTDNETGVCGPDGCLISDHKEKDTKNNASKTN